MGQSLACCGTDRHHVGDSDDRPRESSSRDSASVIDAGATEELEWAIVKKSIEAAELARLQQMARAAQHLDGHEACRSQPRNRQPQTLLRYLRGRDGNVEKGLEMFCNMLDWRVSFEVERKVAEWRRELAEGRSARARIFNRYNITVELCLDRHGVPVVLGRPSVGDLAGMLREVPGGAESLIVFNLAEMERMHQALRDAMFRNDKMLRGQIQILDFGDYGDHGPPKWWNRMYDNSRLAPQIYKVFDSNYPETVRKVFIIRTGWVTHRLFNLAVNAGVIPQRTQKKLRLFGNRASDWVNELRAELPPGAKLPAFLEQDSDAAFAAAEPRGGLLPDGCASQIFGAEACGWQKDRRGAVDKAISKPRRVVSQFVSLFGFLAITAALMVTSSYVLASSDVTNAVIVKVVI